MRKLADYILHSSIFTPCQRSAVRLLILLFRGGSRSDTDRSEEEKREPHRLIFRDSLTLLNVPIQEPPPPPLSPGVGEAPIALAELMRRHHSRSLPELEEGPIAEEGEEPPPKASKYATLPLPMVSDLPTESLDIAPPQSSGDEEGYLGTITEDEEEEENYIGFAKSADAIYLDSSESSSPGNSPIVQMDYPDAEEEDTFGEEPVALTDFRMSAPQFHLRESPPSSELFSVKPLASSTPLPQSHESSEASCFAHIPPPIPRKHRESDASPVMPSLMDLAIAHKRQEAARPRSLSISGSADVFSMSLPRPVSAPTELDMRHIGRSYTQPSHYSHPVFSDIYDPEQISSLSCPPSPVVRQHKPPLPPQPRRRLFPPDKSALVDVAVFLIDRVFANPFATFAQLSLVEVIAEVAQDAQMARAVFERANFARRANEEPPWALRGCAAAVARALRSQLSPTSALAQAAARWEREKGKPYGGELPEEPPWPPRKLQSDL